MSQPSSCPPLPAAPTPSPVRTVGEPSSGLDVEIDELDKKYIDLEIRVLETIKLREIPLKDVLNWIRFPPRTLRIQLTEFLRSEAKQLSSVEEVDELFSILSTCNCCNHFHPDLLHHVISKLSDPDLSAQMERYLDNFHSFRVRTTLGNFMDKWMGGVPPGYKEFVIELGDEWKQKTLEDLRQFQTKIARQQAFGGGWPILKSTKSSSILVILALPQEVFPINFRQKALHDFLRSEGVLKVIVDGECTLDLERLVSLPQNKEQCVA